MSFCIQKRVYGPVFSLPQASLLVIHCFSILFGPATKIDMLVRMSGVHWLLFREVYRHWIVTFVKDKTQFVGTVCVAGSTTDRPYM
jgi:hypothetical protein